MNPPRTKDVSHMFYGPDDGKPMGKLCRGHIRKCNVTQPSFQFRTIDSGPTSSMTPSEPITLTLEVVVFGSTGRKAMELIHAGPVDILIRSIK
jgi:hypothetical protein